MQQVSTIQEVQAPKGRPGERCSDLSDRDHGQFEDIMSFNLHQWAATVMYFKRQYGSMLINMRCRNRFTG